MSLLPRRKCHLSYYWPRAFISSTSSITLIRAFLYGVMTSIASHHVFNPFIFITVWLNVISRYYWNTMIVQPVMLRRIPARITKIMSWRFWFCCSSFAVDFERITNKIVSNPTLFPMCKFPSACEIPWMTIRVPYSRPLLMLTFTTKDEMYRLGD